MKIKGMQGPKRKGEIEQMEHHYKSEENYFWPLWHYESWESVEVGRPQTGANLDTGANNWSPHPDYSTRSNQPILLFLLMHPNCSWIQVQCRVGASNQRTTSALAHISPLVLILWPTWAAWTLKNNHNCMLMTYPSLEIPSSLWTLLNSLRWFFWFNPSSTAPSAPRLGPAI